MPIHRHETKTPRRIPAAALDQLIARAHTQVVKLTRARDQAQRRLVRARMRYSVLTRLAADESKRVLRDSM